MGKVFMSTYTIDYFLNKTKTCLHTHGNTNSLIHLAIKHSISTNYSIAKLYKAVELFLSFEVKGWQ